jgi:hypothetical protein
MLAVAEAVPPAPLQETEYTVLLRGVTIALPLGAPPVENPPPEQLVAFVESQLSVVLCRLWITEGLPARLAVGAVATELTVTVALALADPAASVQVTE